jgi:NAD(P) transhydrogenase subunit alpha
MALIGIVTEQSNESRVAATPDTVKKLIGLGYDVVVESGAGVRASFLDDSYLEAGASVVTDKRAWQADVVLKINAPVDA